MLRVMTKADFWSAIDGGYFKTSGWSVDRWEAFSIKQMQDAVMLSMIGGARDLDILEVGGGGTPAPCPFSGRTIAA